MKKFFLGAVSLAAAITLNATTFATVDGKEITEIELAPLLNGVPTDSLNQLPADAKKGLIDRAIELQLLMSEARKNVKEDDPEFKKLLDIQKNAIALRVYENREFQKVKVTDDEISKFYNENKDKFVEPAQIKASHILVKDEATANEIIKELSALKGDELTKKFAEIAKNRSIEPIASQSGGNLGWFAKEQMVAPFGDEAEKMKKGEISKAPVKTEYGYHVILKEDSKDQRELKLDEVKGYIENFVKQDKFKVQVDEKAKALREKAKVEYK